MPKREDMPPEIAAMGIPAEGDDEEVEVILNSNEDAGAAYRDFRPHVLIPLLLGWAGERALRILRDHQIAAAVTATALATTAVVTGMHTVLDGNGTTIAQPPPAPTMVVTVTPPSASATRRQESSPAPTKPAKPDPTSPPPARLTEPPSALEERRRPSNQPARTPPPSPTRKALRPTPKPTVTATASPEASAVQDVLGTSAPPDIEDTPPGASPSIAEPDDTPDAPDVPGPSADEPTQAARDCAVRVDLDPLLDVCVLS